MFTSIQIAFRPTSCRQFCDHVLVFVFASSLYAALVYNLDFHHPWSLWLIGVSFSVGIGTYGYLRRAQWPTMLFALIFIAMVLFVFGQLREFSWDGLVYHAATPLIMDRDMAGLAGTSVPNGSFYSEHYPKAFEFFAYTAKLLTGKFNSGKSFTLLLSIPALFALMELLEVTGQPRKISTIAAVACIYNPVAIVQLATLYIDAAHYYCWVIFSVNLLFALKGKPYSAIQLGSALALLIASKLTGLVFAAASILAFFSAAFFSAKQHDFLRKNVGVIGLLACWTLIGIAIIGYSPYVQNLVADKNMFYPLAGAGKVDVIQDQVAADFLNMNRASKFFASYFSLPQNSTTDSPNFVPSLAHLRLAFSAFHWADTRYSGFGPFFAVMLVVCLIGFTWKKRGAEEVKWYLAATLGIVLIHPASWWARYVPMLYVVPFLVAGAFSNSRTTFRAITVLAIMNSVFAFVSVSEYLLPKQLHYKSVVASVRTACDHRTIDLMPSTFNWEFDLRDDDLRTKQSDAEQQPGCVVEFDKMMEPKKK